MISVIIPCFNSEELISRAINSVFQQTFKDYEIILIDNNSTDNTYNTLLNYMEKYSGVITVLREYKKGANAARNKGLYEAKGEWLQFLDSDDELLPDKLEKQVALAKNSKADIVAGSHYVYKTIKDKTVVKIVDIETDGVWEALLNSTLGSTSSYLWRRKAVLAVEGWDETITSSQEYDLVFRMLKNNDEMCYCTTPLAIIHFRENSVSKTRDNNRLVEIMDNNVNLRLRVREYLHSADLITKQLGFITDTYIYRYLVNTTGWHPLSFKKGIVPDYVKKKLRQSNLNLPISFIIKLHFTRLRNNVRSKIFKLSRRIVAAS